LTIGGKTETLVDAAGVEANGALGLDEDVVVDPEVAALRVDVGRVFGVAAVAGSQVVLSRHRRKDGSEFPVEVRVAGVRLADGDYVIGMARDITERLRAERALRESERRFRQISRAMSDLAYSCRRAADGSFEIVLSDTPRAGNSKLQRPPPGRDAAHDTPGALRGLSHHRVRPRGPGALVWRRRDHCVGGKLF
jgi:PAS domain-containing protein